MLLPNRTDDKSGVQIYDIKFQAENLVSLQPLPVSILHEDSTECIFSIELTFHCYGKTGSPATPLNDTAGQKVRIVLDRAMEFRQAQKEKLESDPSLTAGDVTSLNLTMMEVNKAGCFLVVNTVLFIVSKLTDTCSGKHDIHLKSRIFINTDIISVAPYEYFTIFNIIQYI